QGHNTMFEITNTSDEEWPHWVFSMNRPLGLNEPTAWGESWQNNGLFVHQDDSETTIRNLGHQSPVRPGESVQIHTYSNTQKFFLPTDFRVRPAERRLVPIADRSVDIEEYSVWHGNNFHHAIVVQNTTTEAGRPRIIQNWEVHFDVDGGGMNLTTVPNAQVIQTTSSSAILAYIPGDGQVLHPEQVLHLSIIGTFVPNSSITNVRVYEHVGTPYDGWPPFVPPPPNGNGNDNGNGNGNGGNNGGNDDNGDNGGNGGNNEGGNGGDSGGNIIEEGSLIFEAVFCDEGFDIWQERDQNWRTVTLIARNTSQTTSYDVDAELNLPENIFLRRNTEITASLGIIQPGEEASAEFQIYVFRSFAERTINFAFDIEANGAALEFPVSYIIPASDSRWRLAGRELEFLEHNVTRRPEIREITFRRLAGAERVYVISVTGFETFVDDTPYFFWMATEGTFLISTHIGCTVEFRPDQGTYGRNLPFIVGLGDGQGSVVRIREWAYVLH
ncbi:MAG: hypothetical protein FWC89_09160, partial [Defluviitaleaceae bacterium]|nr:hypothetical protein [Defluviitaleaceae bacterium]